ncbi:hypothetical protein [Halomonas sp. Ps84H-12]|uniref:capsular polysaccharide export protein, LipB/KpsS family n=1 Tax=Halomonas sp. Ps84H-12 TaxID=2954501 RepID=UPI002097FC3F|nr:hypothetical protein [Halomonas sp. Ps84H-12]MCO7244459.1 hypothetical protein [Halomonas sp. Ps84H-12]
MRVLFSDQLHFHKRNFKSLIEYTEKNATEVIYNTEHHNLMGLKGNYKDCSSLFGNYIDNYSGLDKKTLYEATLNGLNLFEICRAELLCYVSTLANFHYFKNAFNEVEEFDWLYANYFSDLILNISAAHFWIDFWEAKTKKLPVVNNVIVFSGSTIYTRVLLELFKRKVGETYVAESFFTGNEYYLERKSSHIANNSDLKFGNVFNSYSFLSQDDYEREKIKAHNKIRLGKNKNVQQPEVNESLRFFGGEKYILIIGQVVNDFSVLENKVGVRNTLGFYKELIDSILKYTNKKIVFKCHPWERHNVNLKYPKTLNYLSAWSASLPDEFRERLVITENYNLNQLLDGSSLFATLCSQAGLEAAYRGFKPVQFGAAFYGNKGFTHDYNSIEKFISSLQREEVLGKLSLDEYAVYENFITVALQKHLVSVHRSGNIRLKELFLKKNHINLIESPNPGGDVKGEIKKQDIKKPLLIDNKTTKQDFNTEKAIVNDRAKRRLRKLLRKPHSYFKDSSCKIIRPLRYFFKDK